MGPPDDPGAVMSYSDVKAVQFVFHLLDSLPLLSSVKVPRILGAVSYFLSHRRKFIFAVISSDAAGCCEIRWDPHWDMSANVNIFILILYCTYLCVTSVHWSVLPHLPPWISNHIHGLISIYKEIIFLIPGKYSDRPTDSVVLWTCLGVHTVIHEVYMHSRSLSYGL